MLDAIILAGDKKASIILNGKPMVQYVVDALYNSKYIKNIFVVGNLDGKVKNATIVKSGSSFYANLVSGINSAETNNVLISTCDIPLINSEMVDNYLNSCKSYDADIFLPIIEKATSKKFNIERKYRIHLKEGDFRIGYLFLINKEIMNNKKARPILEEMFNNRKADISYIAKFFDFRTKMKFLSKYAAHSLDIPFLENEFSRIFNFKGKILISADPELMMDIDEPEHLEQIKKYLK